MHSRSLRPLIERDDVTRDFARSEWDLRASRCAVDLHLRTVRTQRHKFTLELDSRADELYDLVEDPQEMFNRFDDQSYAAVRRELSDMIASRPADAVAPLPQVGMAQWALSPTPYLSACSRASRIAYRYDVNL